MVCLGQPLDGLGRQRTARIGFDVHPIAAEPIANRNPVPHRSHSVATAHHPGERQGVSPPSPPTRSPSGTPSIKTSSPFAKTMQDSGNSTIASSHAMPCSNSRATSVELPERTRRLLLQEFVNNLSEPCGILRSNLAPGGGEAHR